MQNTSAITLVTHVASRKHLVLFDLQEVNISAKRIAFCYCSDSSEGVHQHLIHKCHVGEHHAGKYHHGEHSSANERHGDDAALSERWP